MDGDVFSPRFSYVSFEEYQDITMVATNTHISVTDYLTDAVLIKTKIPTISYCARDNSRP